MMAFILPVSRCPVYSITQVISSDLVSYLKVREMLRKLLRKSREINFIFMRFKDEKLTDKNRSLFFQINKLQSRIRC